MDTDKLQPESFDEDRSLQVIRDMIEVSRNNLRNDGILFILWGWIFFVSVFIRFLLKILVTTREIVSYVNKILLALLLAGVIISVNYVISRRRMAKTYTGQVLRYLWGAIIFLNLYILVYQLGAHVNIDRLYSQYMLMLAMGTFVTGGIIRFRPLIYGGISFIVLAQIGFFFHYEIGMLIDAFSFVIGLAIPGHILYSKRNK